MSTTRSVTCQNPLCDRYQTPVLVYGHPDGPMECPGTITNHNCKRFACAGALLTDGEWQTVWERAAEAMQADYHEGSGAPATERERTEQRMRGGE